MLEVKSLHKTYFQGDLPINAVTDVSFKAQPGDFLAITGPSGSGKSTVLNMIGGLDIPTSGDVLIDGRSIVTLSDVQRTKMRRNKLGIIFQFFNLLPTMTALENVVLPLLLEGVRRKDAYDKAAEMLGRFGMDKRMHHRPAELSGGEQQRAAIARALVFDPVLVLADEPTGNLDSKSGGQVMDMINSLSREMKKIVVLVTHDPNCWKQADRVLRLIDGKIQSIEIMDRS